MATVIYFLCMVILASAVSAMYSSRALEGYPVGFLADCPGSNKPAFITPKSLRHLSITVLGTGGIYTARRTKYNYYHIKELAKNPDIDFSRKTLLDVGGYLDSPIYPVASAIGKYYKDLGYNVLLLDTNWFTTMEYPVAARYMRPVGKHTAEMLVKLKDLGLNPKTLELIGISLGGQTMSFIAKNYRLQTGMNISRLTGLDPSGPCFRHLGPNERLDQSDADFVDVIATNIDGFGMAAPVGHVNFYVNGGEYQPGDFHWIPCDVFCSHIRSFPLWLAALKNPDSFIAIQCDSVQQARERSCYNRIPRVTNVLGLKTDRSKQGIFFLATNNDFPYYMGEEGLKSENEFYDAHLKAMNENPFIKL